MQIEELRVTLRPTLYGIAAPLWKEVRIRVDTQCGRTFELTRLLPPDDAFLSEWDHMMQYATETIRHAVLASRKTTQPTKEEGE